MIRACFDITHQPHSIQGIPQYVTTEPSNTLHASAAIITALVTLKVVIVN